MTRSPLPLGLLLLVGALTAVLPACGKRGPPLPPLRPAPERVADLTVLRRGDQVHLRFVVPPRNADGSTPVAFDRAEIYALTVAVGKPAPALAAVVTPDHRVAILRPSPPKAADPASTEPPTVAGQTLVFSEAVPVVTDPPAAATPPVAATPAATTPPAARGLGPGPAPGGAATAAAGLKATTRFYVVVPYATRTRAGAASDLLAVPLGPAPAPVSNVVMTWDETTLTVRWTAGAPDQTFHVFAAEPPVVELAAPLTTAPLAKAEWTQPVVFGKARCVMVRAVRGTAPVFFESPPSAPVCETPVDRFPPPAPTGLVAFPGEGGIGLTWDAVTAADLAGYLVLRGEGADDTLRPITPEPLTAATFTDVTARAGVRYTYAVVAVDRATPANRSKESNRVSETGR